MGLGQWQPYVTLPTPFPNSLFTICFGLPWVKEQLLANIITVTKRMKFKFLGTGASGDLGERWAVMTVASALKIWDRERRQRQAAAAGGGGGA